MSDHFLTLFDTSLGRCGIGWGGDGILSVSFPEASDEKTKDRLRRRVRGGVEAAPSKEIQTIIRDIAELFEGERRELSYAPLDMRGIAEFDASVIRLTLEIKPGETRTYGDLAKSLGDVSLSRRVGQALGRNPFPVIVPCHRVVGANDAMTGFSAPGGTDLKRKLLKIEGALAPDLFDLA